MIKVAHLIFVTHMGEGYDIYRWTVTGDNILKELIVPNDEKRFMALTPADCKNYVEYMLSEFGQVAVRCTHGSFTIGKYTVPNKKLTVNGGMHLEQVKGLKNTLDVVADLLDEWVEYAESNPAVREGEGSE